MEYLTAENLTLALVVVLALEKILARIAPKTSNTVDDDVLAKIQAGKNWVRTYAPLISGIVEDLAGTGNFPKVAKGAEFMRRLEAEWNRANPGTPLPEPARAEANLIGAAAAAIFPHAEKPADSIPAPGLPAAGNPQGAPASR
jgi:hypothetical protein